MSYQVRHEMWGIFQGYFLGLGFWTEMSESPEQGLCEFDSQEDAQNIINMVHDRGATGGFPEYHKDYLHIEPFDRELKDKMMRENPVAK